MEIIKYIKNFSSGSIISVPEGICMNTNKAYHSDILLFSRNKVLEPFAPYNL